MKFYPNYLERRGSLLLVLSLGLLSLLVSTGCSGLGLPETSSPERIPLTKSAPHQLAATREGSAAPYSEDTEEVSDFTAAAKTAARCRHSDKRLNCVKVVSVYDGDTVFVDVPGVHPLFGKRVGVRVYGIDTPERTGQAPCEKIKALEAKRVVEGLVTSAKRVDLVELRRDKYFRILAKVLVDGRSIADELLERKLAYPYFGETKVRRDWCE